MTRATMPGRSHLKLVPSCTEAEDFTAAERAWLAELDSHIGAQRLSLVQKPEPTPAADLRRARRREVIEAWTGRVAVLAAAAAAFSALLGRLIELAP